MRARPIQETPSQSKSSSSPSSTMRHDETDLEPCPGDSDAAGMAVGEAADGLADGTTCVAGGDDSMDTLAGCIAAGAGAAMSTESSAPSVTLTLSSSEAVSADSGSSCERIGALSPA